MQRVRDVTLIKATDEKSETQKLRVGAYCRVSTDSEDQLNSFIAQVRHYNDYIRGNDEMVLVDVYADEGITGTSVNKRDEFNRMLRDSKAGKLDRVLVKCVSRFARNALECIKFVRLMKSYGTTVYFENDGIDSKTMNHELILYIKSAFAEGEALSASKRVKRSNQMRMETGEFSFVTAPFGYRMQDNTLVPVEEEAELVRHIYMCYLSGMGFGKIASTLNKSDNPKGKPWGKEKIRYILSNEKYIGDTLHQKTYTPDGKPYQNKRNRGEVDQYYVSCSHEPILDRELYYAVKEMIDKNREMDAQKAKPKEHKYTGKIFCGDCSWTYKRSIQNGVVSWVCAKNGTVGQRCKTHPLSEEVIARTFCNMYNKLRQHENELLKSTYNRLLELKGKITKTRSEILDIDEEILTLSDKISYFSQLLNNQVIDSEVYNSRVNVARKRVAELRSRRKKLLREDDDEQCIDELRQVIARLENSPKAIILYDHKLFRDIVNRVTVQEAHLDFELKGGIVLKEAIAWN